MDIKGVGIFAPNAAGFLTIKDAICFLRLASFGANFPISKNMIGDILY
tara:strand:- start:395 stop:538 length:144 start_codon:yes stop_codon:yes gene_type:complete